MRKSGHKILTGIFIIFITGCWLLAADHYCYAQQPEMSIEEERLNILKSDIQREIRRFEQLKSEIEEARRALEVKQQERVLHVAKIYQAMSPQDAAERLEKLDKDTAVAILISIRPRAAGKILAQMESERAALLSKKLISGRKN